MINVCNLLEFNLNNKIIPKPPNPTPSLTSNHKGHYAKKYSTALLMCLTLEHLLLLLIPMKHLRKVGPADLQIYFHDAGQLSAPSYHPLSFVSFLPASISLLNI